MHTPSSTILVNNANITRELAKIDESIFREAVRLQELAKAPEFEPVMEFELNNEIPTIPEMVWKKRGIYFFEIRNKDTSMPPAEWIHSFTRYPKIDVYKRGVFELPL